MLFFTRIKQVTVQYMSLWIRWIKLWNCMSHQLWRSWKFVFPLNLSYPDHFITLVEFAATKQVQKLKFDFCIPSAPNPTESSYDPFYDGFLASPGAIRLYWLRDLCLRGVNVSDNVISYQVLILQLSVYWTSIYYWFLSPSQIWSF